MPITHPIAYILVTSLLKVLLQTRYIIYIHKTHCIDTSPIHTVNTMLYYISYIIIWYVYTQCTMCSKGKTVLPSPCTQDTLVFLVVTFFVCLWFFVCFCFVCLFCLFRFCFFGCHFFGCTTVIVQALLFSWGFSFRFVAVVCLYFYCKGQSS